MVAKNIRECVHIRIVGTHCIHVRNLIVENNLLNPVGSKAVVLLLLIYCFMYLHSFWGFCVGLCFGTHNFMSFIVLQSF